MKLSNIFKSSLVLALLLSVATFAPVSATPATAVECSVKMVGNKNTADGDKSRWSISSDGTVTGKVVVTGNEDCEQTVTLAAWEAPDADKGLPYSAQKLVGSVTKTFTVGTHSMSIKLPNCFYQIDLVRGDKATNDKGTPEYAEGVIAGSLHGGTKKCETPKTPEVPAELPKTGAGTNVVVMASAVTVLGTMFQSRRLRRTA